MTGKTFETGEYRFRKKKRKKFQIKKYMKKNENMI